jgi:hypothetical protein
MAELDFDRARSMMAPSLLAQLVPLPRRRQRLCADLAAPPAVVWKIIRHGDLARTRSLRVLLRLVSAPPSGGDAKYGFRLGDLLSTPEKPGFRLLAEEPSSQLTFGALARARRMQLSFVHASSVAELVACQDPSIIKLAWSAQLSPLGAAHSRLRVELRLGAADEAAWRSARAYFACLGPVLHWAQRQVIGSLADELGWPGMSRQQPATADGFWKPAASR